MSPELSIRIASTTATIRRDIANDMSNLEGAPLDARTVSVAFGNLAAQVDALAGMLNALAAEDGPR